MILLLVTNLIIPDFQSQHVINRNWWTKYR